jgi:hypothetical protein
VLQVTALHTRPYATARNLHIQWAYALFIHQPAPAQGSTARFAQPKLYNNFNRNSNKTVAEIVYKCGNNVCRLNIQWTFTYILWDLPTYLSVYLPIYLPNCLSDCLPTYLSVYLTTYLSIYLPTCLATYVCTYLTTYLPGYLHIYLCMYVCMYVSIYPSFIVKRHC